MAKKLSSYEHIVEDDYIDIDIGSTTTYLCYTTTSPPHSKEFEFQMHSDPPSRETTTSSADELFYKGKLLPLHLPPRHQMVEKLLQNPNNNLRDKELDPFEENLETNITITTTTTTASTPLESCNISPTDSCYVSGELNPEECFYECSSRLVQSHSKRSWSKKFKLIKQSSLGLKLKASRAYLKSLFTKSGSSDEPSEVPKTKEEKRNPSGQFQKGRYLGNDINAATLKRSIEREKLIEEECLHRRSFSGAINRHSTTKSSPAISSCSSSSSSFSSVNSNGFYGPHLLKRSSSVNSEVESSIQGAIAYCKKSQQPARKSISDVRFCSMAASRIAAACENKERPGLCRG